MSVKEMFDFAKKVPVWLFEPLSYLTGALPWASVHRLVQCTLECHWNATGWFNVHWDTTEWPSECLHGTLEHHWKILVEIAPHWNATGETLIVAACTGTPLAGLLQPPKPRHKVSGLKWQDGGTTSSKWTCLCKFSFYLEFTALQWIPVLFFKRVSISISLSSCLEYEHHYSLFFVYLGLQFKSKKLSQNNSHHTRFIHKGLHTRKWPDLMSSKLSVRRDTTGQTTLKPHWLMLSPSGVPVVSQWCHSGNPVLICIIGTHWKTLESQIHCDASRTTLPLDCHWIITSSGQGVPSQLNYGGTWPVRYERDIIYLYRYIHITGVFDWCQNVRFSVTFPAYIEIT